jgi:myo-inositol-1(or 4)-monophosphatase
MHEPVSLLDGVDVPELAPEDREVIAEGLMALTRRLDEVGPRLLAAAGGPDVTIKPDGTPVTDHDRATDELLVSSLLDTFPDHGTISEEQGTLVPASRWTWVLDPIDGTSNFIAGLPYWCVSVALCRDGVPVLGVIDAPALGRRYVATAGEGAWAVGVGSAGGEGARHRLTVGPGVDLSASSSAHVPALYSSRAARDLVRAGVTLNARLLGSTALDMAMVASGVAPLAVAMKAHVWDVAAGFLLVTEAGGAVGTWGADTLLPLRVGRDEAHVDVPTIAAADATTAERAALALEASVRPVPIGEAQASAWGE